MSDEKLPPACIYAEPSDEGDKVCGRPGKALLLEDTLIGRLVCRVLCPLHTDGIETLLTSHAANAADWSLNWRVGARGN